MGFARLSRFVLIENDHLENSILCGHDEGFTWRGLRGVRLGFYTLHIRLMHFRWFRLEPRTPCWKPKGYATDLFNIFD